jgi:hypothetical protein
VIPDEAWERFKTSQGVVINSSDEDDNDLVQSSLNHFRAMAEGLNLCEFISYSTSGFETSCMIGC